MKKKWQKLIAAGLCILLLIPLAGCGKLEEMQENQAFLQEDGSILWNGVIYKELEKENFHPVINGNRIVYVTEEDVPALLSETFCVGSVRAGDNPIFLQNNMRLGVYYCREDQYDIYAERLQKPFEPKELCFRYWDTNDPEKCKTYFYTLSKTEASAVEKVLTEVSPRRLLKPLINPSLSVFILESTADHTFTRTYTELFVNESGMFLLLQKDHETWAYEVPKAMQPVFNKMTEPFPYAK